MLPQSSATEYVRCNLSQNHLDGLRKRGLTDQTIMLSAFTTELSASKIRKNLGHNPEHEFGACLAIPYFDPEGKPALKQTKQDHLFLPDAYVRYRPDQPRPKDDDPNDYIKYESPCNVLNHAYFPIGTRREILSDANVPLIVTEGEFKAAKADQEGFHSIGLVGVWGWQIGRQKKKLPDGRERSHGKRFLIPDLCKVEWNGRTAFLIFDSDITSKVEVQWALWRLSQALRKRKAIVKMVLLPEGPNGGKVGLDDFLVANGSDALRKLIDQAKPPTRPMVKPGKAGKDASGVELVMKIVDRHELLLSPSDRNERYVSSDRLTMELATDGIFEDFISYEYFSRTGTFLTKEDFNASLSQLRSHCFFRGQEREIFVRMGETSSAIYLSLNDKDRNVIEIDRDGWRQCDKPPVRFRCSPTMMALPVPRKGGKITDLKPFLNVHDSEDFALVIGFLTGCFNVRGPHPGLIAGGEAGSGKTTACRAIKKLIDNTKALSRSEAGEEKDLVIAAKNSWLMVFDNISKLSADSSDSYAKLSTGAGLSCRQKYTDDGEWVSEVKRPFILNGIEDFVRRGDLRDRCIFVNFPNIPPKKRLTEKEFWGRFEEAHPFILGALLDRVSAGLRETPHLPADLELPRMADFCKFVHACELGMREKPVFLEAFHAMQIAQISSEMEDSVLAYPITRLASEHRSGWTGTPGELLKVLGSYSKEFKSTRWPRSTNLFSSMLRRLAPALRKAVQIDIQFFRETSHSRRRMICITSPGLFDNPSSGSSGAQSTEESVKVCDDQTFSNPSSGSSGAEALAPDDPDDGSQDLWSSQLVEEKPHQLAPDDPDDLFPKSPAGEESPKGTLFNDGRGQLPPD